MLIEILIIQNFCFTLDFFLPSNSSMTLVLLWVLHHLRKLYFAFMSLNSRLDKFLRSWLIIFFFSYLTLLSSNSCMTSVLGNICFYSIYLSWKLDMTIQMNKKLLAQRHFGLVLKIFFTYLQKQLLEQTTDKSWSEIPPEPLAQVS